MTWPLFALVLAGLVSGAASHAKGRPRRVTCKAGYIRRSVREPKRHHGHIVRVRGKIVYVRVVRCVKTPVKTPTKPTRPPVHPVTPPPVTPPPVLPPPPPPVAPGNTAVPQISGTTRVGQTLSVSPGTWTGTPAPKLSYQWQRCDPSGGRCHDVLGGASVQYSLAPSDIDSTLRVVVSGTNPTGSAAAMSGTTSVIGAVSDPVAAAVGDVACPAGDTTNDCRQAATASLAASEHPGAVLMLGDAQYNSGLTSEYLSRGAYNDTWGQFNSIVHPVPGNHDYTASATAAGYFGYFGEPPNYYSFNLGTWHIVALNSDCSDSGCGDQIPGVTTSAQTSWLQSDLAANRSACVLAFWHHPRFASGFVGDSPDVASLWDALYAAHADVVLNGHDHLYERYAPQDPSGTATSTGIREFVVGTGGENLSPVVNSEGNLEVSDDRDFGVLGLTLHAAGYDWAFKNTQGAVIDSGSGTCHGPGTGAGAARDRSRSAALRRTEPGLAFDARPRAASVRVVERRGLRVAIHCSRACDVSVDVTLLRGGRRHRIAALRETESEITKPYSEVTLRLASLPHVRRGGLRLMLRFVALDAAYHHRVVVRDIALPR